jgi:hypothetical protein
MFGNLKEYVFGKNKKNIYIKFIKEYYDIQYIYCEDCIRNFNKPCKLTYFDNNKGKNFICLECNKTVSIHLIRDEDFIFDNKELKNYILNDDSYKKVKTLLIYWRQSKNIYSNNDIIKQILLDLMQDNFHTLFQYDPNYLPV